MTDDVNKANLGLYIKLEAVKESLPVLTRNKFNTISKKNGVVGIWYCTEGLLRAYIEPLLKEQRVTMWISGCNTTATAGALNVEYAFDLSILFVDMDTGARRLFEQPGGGGIAGGLTTATRLFLDRFFCVKSIDPPRSEYSSMHQSIGVCDILSSGAVQEPDTKNGEPPTVTGKTDIKKITQMIKDNAQLYSNEVKLVDTLNDSFNNKPGFIGQACLAIAEGDPKKALLRMKDVSSINGQSSPSFEHLKQRGDIFTIFCKTLDAMEDDILKRTK